MGVFPDLISAVRVSSGGVTEVGWQVWGGKKSVLTHRSRYDFCRKWCTEETALCCILNLVG